VVANINLEPLWTSLDVAAYLRLKRSTVLTMARNKQIPAIRVGRIYRFRKSDINRWLEEQRERREAA